MIHVLVMDWYKIPHLWFIHFWNFISRYLNKNRKRKTVVSYNQWFFDLPKRVLKFKFLIMPHSVCYSLLVKKKKKSAILWFLLTFILFRFVRYHFVGMQVIKICIPSKFCLRRLEPWSRPINTFFFPVLFKIIVDWIGQIPTSVPAGWHFYPHNQVMNRWG